MNKLFRPFLVLCTVIALASCSTDDDDGSSNFSGNLVGTWEMMSFDYEGTTTVMADGLTIATQFVGVAQNIAYTLEFSENPNEFVSDGTYDIELTSTLLDQTSAQTVELGDLSGSGTYTLDGTTLSVTGDLVSVQTGGVLGEETTGDITISQLTDTTLILTQETIQEQTVGAQSFTVTLSSEIVFTRQ